MMKGIKGMLAVGIASIAMLVGMRSSAEDTQLTRGLDWLQAQVQSNGTLSSERDSLAVVEQVRTEAAHTLAQAGRTSRLPDLTPGQLSDLSTELLSRRVIALAATGRTDDAATVLAVLLPRTNADGGFGGAVNQPSNPLDTSLALLAMRAGGLTRHARVQSAIGYLMGAPNADGSYSLGQSTYTTAYALQAFVRFRNDYSLASTIQRTRAALLAQQDGGVYPDVVANAVATIALAQSGPVTDAAAAVTALRNAQQTNGSWGGDPYVTAVALRALLVASTTHSTNTGRIVGEVYDASSGLPLGQAHVTLSGSPVTAVSDATTGGFALENIPAGSYTVTVAHAGYASSTGPATVEGDGTTNLGRIALGLADGTAVLRGRVTDSSSSAALAGVSVRVSGPLTTQTQTNAQGHYELVGLPAGDYAIQMSLTGYQSLTQSATLPSRTVVTFAPALTPEGETPPTTASAFGTVVKATDASPLAGAQVQVNGRQVTTGSDGKFVLEGLDAGAFTGQVLATGYDSVTVSGLLANGANDFGNITLTQAQSPRRTLVGSVTSQATGQPIATATLTLNGAAAGQTDAAGQYRIDDTGTADVSVRFDAAGFESRTLSVRLENPGTYRLDAVLDDLREGTFQVLNLRTAPASALPGESMRITADIANLTTEQKPALILVRVLDSDGAKVAQLCGAEMAGNPATCEYAFDAEQIKPFVADWSVPNLPTGNYTLAIHVVEPGSVQRETPLGLVYGSDRREIQIKPTLGLQGTVTPSPPVMIANSPNGVDFTATVQNKGNDTIPAGEATLSVIDRAGSRTVHTVTIAMSALLPNDIAELDFGHWQPTATKAQYDLKVVATNPAVGGVVTGEFYVGDAASGDFTVTPTETADGTQRVEATLTVKGINNPSGQAADPLFTLVRQAVTRGGGYTATNAVNWQRSHQCLGCHIQTQSLYGLASSISKADIDETAALFLQNSQSGMVQSDASIYSHHPGFRLTSSVLGLWGMTAWPNREATFNARYRLADYLYGRRSEHAPSNGVYWWYDHATGWLVENPATTATAVEGIASVLRDADRYGVTQMQDYRATSRATTPARMVDLAGAPDGLLYTLQSDGKIFAYDPAVGTSTLFATAKLGSSYTGIAIGENGSVYVASVAKSGQAPVIEQVTPAENTVVATLPLGADAIDVTHDQKIVALNRGTRSIYLVDPAAGTNLRIAIGGLIPQQSASVTAAKDGAVFVTGSSGSGYGAIRIARDGTQKRVHEGNFYELRDIVFNPSGRAYAGGDDAIYGIGSHGVIERFTGGGSKNKLAIVGGRLFGLNPNASTQLWEIESVATDIRPRLTQMRVAVEKAARHFETYPNYGLPAEAFRLILLAEARPHITDSVLATKVDVRIPELAGRLRAAQRSDGGWSRYPGYPSDPLTTAIVGTALDYTAPEPTDPVLRKTVQYLLTKQTSDGSWTGQYFSTNLGATSYVMAYLPKAVARLGGIDVGLGLEFGPDTRLVNSSVTPSTSTMNGDGSSSYFFNLGRINAEGARFVFTIDLLAMKIDEWRKIASRAFLRFINSFNGEIVEAPIAIPSVRGVSKYQLNLALNRHDFRANEDVLVQPTVRNNGSPFTSGSVRYFIETAQGGPVTELTAVAFTDMAVGTERTLPQPWSTGISAAGDYRARVVLLNPDGQVWGEAIAPFRILTTSPGPQLSSSVTTDKPVYDPFDTVSILGKVRNLTLNGQFEQLTVTESVTTPADTVLFTADRTISVLPANSVHALTVPVNLLGAAAGTYTVTQVVKAADGQVLDTQIAHFDVRSTGDNGAGLAGTVAAVPQEVEVGATTSLVVGVHNRGNADLADLPLVVSVVNPDTEAVLGSWTQTRNLARGESAGYSVPWSTANVAPGDYQVVLQARVGTGLLTLAHGPVRVIEPPIDAEMDQELSAIGRVLVLMTCRQNQGGTPGDGSNCTRDRATFVAALLTRLGIEHKVVIDTQAFAREYGTGRYDTYWISGGAQKLANTLAEELGEATFQGDGLFVDGAHDSRNQTLDDALGVVFRGQLSGNRHHAVMSGDFDVGQFDASGDALRYEARTAQIRGRYDSASGTPAFFVNRYGDGRSAVAGFDLVAALAGSGSAAQATELLRRTLAHVTPPPPTHGLTGGYLSVRTQVRNLVKPAEFILRITAATPLRVEDARPQATMTPTMAQWQFWLGLAESREFRVGLRLPAASGTYVLDSNLLIAATPTGPALDSNRLSITVASPRELGVLLMQELDRLPLSQQSEQNARNRVRSLVGTALDAQEGGDGDRAVGELLKAVAELQKIRSVSTDDCHVQLSALVKSARVSTFH